LKNFFKLLIKKGSKKELIRTNLPPEKLTVALSLRVRPRVRGKLTGKQMVAASPTPRPPP
jgi:hypothetical protein